MRGSSTRLVLLGDGHGLQERLAHSALEHVPKHQHGAGEGADGACLGLLWGGCAAASVDVSGQVWRHEGSGAGRGGDVSGRVWRHAGSWGEDAWWC